MEFYRRLLIPDAQSWKEQLFVLVMAGLSLIVPPLVVDFYPWSTFPMFSDAPRSLVTTRVLDADGKPLALSAVGISDYYFANPNPRANTPLQRDRSASHRFWRPDEFVPMVSRALASGAATAPLTFEQRLIGEIRIGERRTVGPVAHRVWKIGESGAYQLLESEGE